VIVAASPVPAGAAVLLWGLGASLGFPLALSAAGESGPDGTARVSLVAVIGYVAFLVGPPGHGRRPRLRDLRRLPGPAHTSARQFHLRPRVDIEIGKLLPPHPKDD
jgi:hypothetical protein